MKHPQPRTSNPGLLSRNPPSTRNFSNRELCCSCCGKNEMHPEFLEKLQTIRDLYGKPMRLNSGYRCPEFNATISKTGPDGPHTTGRAVDIAISGQDALHVLDLALSNGCTGIGLSQIGDYAGRFLHVDDLTEGIRPHIWTYPSNLAMF